MHGVAIMLTPLRIWSWARPPGGVDGRRRPDVKPVNRFWEEFRGLSIAA